MPTHLTIDGSAKACLVSRDTIKRRLRKGQFPGAVRGEPHGDRPAPWLIPVDELVAAGLRPVLATEPSSTELQDPEAMRLALARHEAMGVAREAHLADLRVEIRRLHERLAELSDLVRRQSLRSDREDPA